MKVQHRIRDARLAVLVVVTLVSTAGCASSTGGSAELRYSRDLAEMKERILELQEQAAMAEVEIKQLRQQVVALEKRLAAASEVSTPPPPIRPSSAAQDAAGSEQQTGSLEVEESDLMLDTPTEDGSGGSSPDPTGAASDSGPESATDASATEVARESPAGQAVEPAAQALYDRGYTLFHQQRYLDAEASFQRFLQAYPQTDLSDNALFWIGESRYQRGDFQGALAAFRETIQGYPEGNKIPDAMIKEGDCLAQLGDRDGARAKYEEVRRRFPAAAASIVAEERLGRLD